jgi:thymidine kinase
MTERRDLGKSPEFGEREMQAGIDVICGPMFSGKSDELIRRIRRFPYAGFVVMAFKPFGDDRRGINSINSEDGAHFDAIVVMTSKEILTYVDEETNVVAIDEGQFFDEELPEVCRELAARGKKVIVAGLDKNFRGEPFGPMGELKQEADHVDTLHAYCTACGRLASRTQRIKIVDGERMPANYDDPIILVGAKEAYEARCRTHHEVPGRPEGTKT